MGISYRVALCTVVSSVVDTRCSNELVIGIRSICSVGLCVGSICGGGGVRGVGIGIGGGCLSLLLVVLLGVFLFVVLLLGICGSSCIGICSACICVCGACEDGVLLRDVGGGLGICCCLLRVISMYYSSRRKEKARTHGSDSLSGLELIDGFLG